MEDSKASVMHFIMEAEKLLPGMPSLEGDSDPRWQAIIAIGEYIQDEPQAIWQFICKWGESSSEDLRMAIATCLLEHLLEYHFHEYFPKVREMCRRSKIFASTFEMCAQFGQSKQRENSQAFLALMKEIS